VKTGKVGHKKKPVNAPDKSPKKTMRYEKIKAGREENEME
jgi:hypothetical protein